ncbi:MAG: hypothetical protein A2Y45_07630 [Tenericutes bacterium GWC2_34_14]|nr:MAG: hypothetical protein A2Z84_02500 [Tenericutes bacterium GWA2_35_7]OHE29770.1 MAG: hypothetical protein A2Y45_07630 [Tenericutes bacterium GWC2_34_14]OHE34749.1 MAG: hypothetical protein A2012_01240 [Tenericutes bacterium GWE2_34_108]OHE37390.1 MAG: hypothetical protein A2Y46_01770 [Tenericutes bacterium GWF1_35_14]OHE42560.1 MAG: hypothetical protein A3K26_04190 [Tenericutes bacterium RIFOXYA12_FULL_35_10]OHE44334.1 MAG: hypothetical protein A2221_04420 [Tenericutes bacterium RIFOXYA2_
MLQSNGNTKVLKVQRIYFLISLGMILLSGILFVLGYVFTQAVESAPVVILTFAVYFLYYHIAHFLFGFGSLIYYIRGIRKKIFQINVFKTIAGILFTPVSAIILYAAILLLALSNCAG